MNINYYDNVYVTYPKKGPNSISQSIYNAGTFLSEMSGRYNGKTVSLFVFYGTPHGGTASMEVDDKQKPKYTRIEKVEAYAGACLKQFAAFLNSDIKLRQIHPTAFLDAHPSPLC